MRRSFYTRYQYEGAKGKTFNFTVTERVGDDSKKHLAALFLKNPGNEPQILWIHYNEPTYPTVFINALKEVGVIIEGIGCEYGCAANLSVSRHPRSEAWQIYSGSRPFVKVELFNSTLYSKALDYFGFVINDHVAFLQLCIKKGLK